MGMAFAIIAVVAQVVVVQYGRAAVRHAVDEGVRAGSALGAGIQACDRRAEQVMRGPRGVLGGELGRHIRIECRVDHGTDPPHVVAVARGELSLELPMLGPTFIEVRGSAVVEQEP